MHAYLGSGFELMGGMGGKDAQCTVHACWAGQILVQVKGAMLDMEVHNALSLQKGPSCSM